MRSGSNASRRSAAAPRHNQEKRLDVNPHHIVNLGSSSKLRRPVSSGVAYFRLGSVALVLMLVCSGWLYMILMSFPEDNYNPSFLRQSSSWRLHILRTATLPPVAFLARPRVISMVTTQIPKKLPESSRKIDNDTEHNILYSETKYLKQYRYPDRIGGKDQDCHPAADWQMEHHPTCSSIHELDLTHDPFFVAAGGYRRVFKIFDSDADRTPRVLKTLNVPMDDSESGRFDLRNADRHRRDALAFEQLTHSPYVVEVFGLCGNSAVFNFGSGGDLTKLFHIEPDITDARILKIAKNITLAMRDAHNADPKDGLPTMAHTDIKPDQFLLEGGYYKLTDFNRVRFLGHKETEHGPEVCPFTVSSNKGVGRAPEEYAYEPETHNVDIYSLGNIFHFLLTREHAWYHDMDKYELDEEAVYQKIMNGERPEMPRHYRHLARDHPENPFIKYMLRARDMCLVRDQKDRPDLLEVAAVLQKGIDELE